MVGDSDVLLLQPDAELRPVDVTDRGACVDGHGIAELLVVADGALPVDLGLADVEALDLTVERKPEGDGREEGGIPGLEIEIVVGGEGERSREVQVGQERVEGVVDRPLGVVEAVAAILQIEPVGQRRPHRGLHVERGQRQPRRRGDDDEGLIIGHPDSDLESVDGQAVGLSLPVERIEGVAGVLGRQRRVEGGDASGIDQRLSPPLGFVEHLHPFLGVPDGLELHDQPQEVLRDVEEELAAEALEVAGGVDEVALRLDEILAGDQARAAQERDVGGENNVGGLHVLTGDALMEVLDGLREKPRRGGAAVGKSLGHPQLVDQPHGGVERAAVAHSLERRREVIEEAWSPQVPLDEQPQGAQDILLFGEAIVAAVAHRVAQGRRQVHRHGVGRLLCVALEPFQELVDFLVGGAVQELVSRGVHGGQPLGGHVGARVGPLAGRTGEGRTARGQGVRPQGGALLGQEAVDPPVDAPEARFASGPDRQPEENQAGSGDLSVEGRND